MSYFKFKSRFLKVFFATSVAVFMQLSGGICIASGVISQNSYTLPEGKDVLMGRAKNPSSNLVWSSDNTKVATVDSWGIVHAKSRGKAKITAKDKQTGNESTCILEVKGPEPFKNVITSRNIADVNESFEIKAFTSKKVEAVKFDISSGSYSNTVHGQKKKDENGCAIWSRSVKLPKYGKFKIKAFGKINGSWKSCSEGSSEIYISGEHKSLKPTFSEKRISDKCSDFIILCEGFIKKVYKDYAGILTIACGERIYPFTPFYNNLSREEGVALLSKSINQRNYTKSLNKFLRENKIKCNQQQFDALVSFCYNVGCGWLTNGSRLSKILIDSEEKTGKFYGIVNSDTGLYVRSSPSTSSKKICVLKNGFKVELISEKKENGDWYKVKVPGGGVGYCFGSYLKTYYEKSKEKNLNNIDKNKFISELSMYHHVNYSSCKKCCKGLIKRRFEELDIFFKGIYSRNTGWRGAGNYPVPNCASRLF